MLLAVSGSRVALGFQSAFHKEIKTLDFSQVLYKESNISRVGRESQKRAKTRTGSRREETQRRIKTETQRGLEINSSIISLICLVCFLLLFMDFDLVMSG